MDEQPPRLIKTITLADQAACDQNNDQTSVLQRLHTRRNNTTQRGSGSSDATDPKGAESGQKEDVRESTYGGLQSQQASLSMGRGHAIRAVLVLFCMTSIAAHEVYTFCLGRTFFNIKARLPLQVTSVSYWVVHGINLAAVIPLSYDTVLAMHLELKWPHINQTMLSGLVVGSFFIAYPLALCAVTWTVTQPYKHTSARLVAVFFSCVMVASNLLCGCILASPSMSGIGKFMFLLGSRGLQGFASGAVCIISTMGIMTSSKEELVAMGLAGMICVNMGYGLGPLTTSIVSSCADKNAPSATHLAETCFTLGMIWLVFAFSTSIVTPALELPIPAADDIQVSRTTAENASEDLRFDACSQESRTNTFTSCLLYNSERAFTAMAIEVTTAVVLEKEYHWRAIQIGFAAGIMSFFACFLCLFAMLFRFLGVVGDARMAVVGSLIGTASVLFLFDIAGPLLLVFGDSLLYSMLFVVNGIVDGWASKAAIQDTQYSIAWYQFYKQLLACVTRFAAAPLARLLVDVYGRNCYATMQLVLACLGSLTVFKIKYRLESEINGGTTFVIK